MRVAVVPLSIALITLGACGDPKTCAASCDRFYAADQCDAAPAGIAQEEAIAGCTRECNAALQAPASDTDFDATDPWYENDRRFNPNFVAPLDKTHELTNDREAAAWIDCVWYFSDTECNEKLSAQYCAKIF